MFGFIPKKETFRINFKCKGGKRLLGKKKKKKDEFLEAQLEISTE